MVVNTIAKPHLLQIFLEIFIVFRIFVALIIGVDIFEKFAYLEVVAAVLIPDNVAASLSGFAQVIDHFLLIERQTVELRHFIAKHFDVGEAVDVIVEVFIDHGSGLHSEHRCEN